MPLTEKGEKIMKSMKRTYGVKRVSKYSTQQPTLEKLKMWRKKKNSRKVAGLEKLANRRSLKRRARVELMKLATTLSPQ